MKKAVFLFFSFILFSCCIEQKEQQENKYQADTNWTFMFYFGADNDLEYYLLRNIKQIKENYSGNVNLIFLIDRSSSYSSNSKILGEDFAGSRVFQLLPNAKLEVISKDSFEKTNQALMLKKFIDLGKEKLPAKHYALFIGSHGGGARSMNYNVVYSQSRGEWIYTHEFSDVLSINESVDLLALDACFMGNLEFLYQIRPGNGSFQADFVIASAPTEWSYGWDYENLLAKISKFKSNEITPLLLGELILENHKNYTESEELDDQVLSLFDMQKVADVKKATDDFFVMAKDMKQGICELRGYNYISQKETLHYFDSSAYYEWLEYSYFDLYDIAEKSKKYEKLSTVAMNLTEAVEQAIISSFAGSYFKKFIENKTGMSIFFPDGDRLYREKAMWENQKWYNANAILNQGKLAFCKDGATENNQIVENYFEVLDFWFDSDNTEDTNEYMY